MMSGKSQRLHNGLGPLVTSRDAVAVTPEIHFREVGKDLGLGHLTEKQHYKPSEEGL